MKIIQVTRNTVAIALTLSLPVAHAQTTTTLKMERTPGDEQYIKDIQRYTRDQYHVYSDDQLEKSRLVWLKKKKTCQKNSNCKEVRFHLNAIATEQKDPERIERQKRLSK